MSSGIFPAKPRSKFLFLALARIAEQRPALVLLDKNMPGMTSDDMVQVVTGLEAGEQVVTKGSLFIDRAATGS